MTEDSEQGRTTFRDLLARDRPLVMPGAHDAISASLIARAGFKAYFIGGFPLVHTGQIGDILFLRDG